MVKEYTEIIDLCDRITKAAKLLNNDKSSLLLQSHGNYTILKLTANLNDVVKTLPVDNL